MSVDPESFVATLLPAGGGFVTGVPDSLLAGLNAYLGANLGADRHVIAVNEGGAVALAAGAWLGGVEIPVVYLQNSGLGNAVNPLMSLAHPDVASVPLVLIIGWRGHPEDPDEPQHRPQGQTMVAQLEAMGIPWRLLPGQTDAACEAAGWARRIATDRQGPVALLVRPKTFAKGAKPAAPVASGLAPATAIELIMRKVSGPVIATTGYIGREVLAFRQANGSSDDGDFLNVGAMGHASQIALGMAATRSDLEVTCLDGDGAALMHMGALALNGASDRANLLHVVLNNGQHASVGGQPTVAREMEFCAIARACGYQMVEGPVMDAPSLREALARLATQSGPRFLEVYTTAEHGALPRPAPGFPEAVRGVRARFARAVPEAESD